MALHMNGGQGDTSYVKNSELQRSIIQKTKHILEDAVGVLCTTESTVTSKTMKIEDLGCGSGPNTLHSVTMILDAIQHNCSQVGHQTPEFQVFLNDLPENDFNTLFKIISTSLEKLRGETGGDSRSCFMSGCPGSFYGRLFPTESMHFFYSSSSLHWLSKVPSILNRNNGIYNKGNIALGKTSPSDVFVAYLEQFHSDFMVFLKSRSQEIVPKGCMVLSFVGRRSINPFTEEGCCSWDVVAAALRDMVEEGIVEEEKLDSFNMPFFEPHLEDVRKVIEEEGSFDIIHLEALYMDASSIVTEGNRKKIYKILSSTQRSAIESMLSHHFGPTLIDRLFERVQGKFKYSKKIGAILLISLSKKG